MQGYRIHKYGSILIAFLTLDKVKAHSTEGQNINGERLVLANTGPEGSSFENKGQGERPE